MSTIYTITEKEIAEKLSNSVILVTGASGMIGQNIVKTIIEINDTLDAKIKIIANVRDTKKAERVFYQEISRQDFLLLTSSIENLQVSGKVDYIIHTVGVTGGSKQHIEFPVRTISVSLEGTKRVLDIAVEKKIKGMVFLSSLEVYGNTGREKKYIFETDGGYVDPVNLRSSYSESKRMCECMFAAYAKQYNTPAIVARLTASFGYGVSYKDDRVFAQFARSVIEGKNIILKSTGETVRDYCDTKDVAMALLVLLCRGVPGEAYNIANMQTEISIKDLALAFIRIFPENGTKLIFDLADDIATLGYNKTMRNVLNSNKIMALGWVPKYGIDDMIIHLVDSMRNSKEVL